MSDSLAKKKRFEVAKLAYKLAKLPIIEDGQIDNIGYMLDEYIGNYYSEYKNRAASIKKQAKNNKKVDTRNIAWCAAFASSCIIQVDKKLGGESGAISMGSKKICKKQIKDINRPVVGCSIAWSTSTDSGHVGIVVWHNGKTGNDLEVVVAEGNTGGLGKSGANNREGICTMVKKYQNKHSVKFNLYKPGSKHFVYYGVIWNESDKSLYSPFSPSEQQILNDYAKHTDTTTPQIARNHYIKGMNGNVEKPKNMKAPPDIDIAYDKNDNSNRNSSYGGSSSRSETAQEKPKPSMRDLGVDAGSAVGIELAALSEFKPTEPVSTNKITQKDKESFAHESKVVSTPTIITKDPSTITINEPQQT